MCLVRTAKKDKWAMGAFDVMLQGQEWSREGEMSVLQTVWSHCSVRWASLQPKHDRDGISCKAVTPPSHLKLPYPQKETHMFSHGSHFKIHRSYTQTDITHKTETWKKKASPWTSKRDVGLLQLYWADGLYDPQMAPWTGGHSHGSKERPKWRQTLYHTFNLYWLVHRNI